MRGAVTVQNGLRSTSSLSETFQRLEEKVVRVQTEQSRDVAAIRENQARLERRINELPQQQRTASLPGKTNILCVCVCLRVEKSGKHRGTTKGATNEMINKTRYLFTNAF